MNGAAVRFPFLTRRRYTFRAAKATSNALGMYCLYTRCSSDNRRYAVLARRTRDRMSSRSAIRIDLLTMSRNSASRPRREGGRSPAGKERLRTTGGTAIEVVMAFRGLKLQGGGG